MSDLVTERRSPKYSIIIPTKDGMPYLEYCLRSVLSNDRQDIEVIVSVDDETLETKEYLSTLADSRVRILKPEPGLSMSEHWDFAQLHAVGGWQIFLGQDDMLVSGYEQIFDELTAAANLSGLEVVVSRRAYITWPPIRSNHLRPLQYWRTNNLEIIKSEAFVAKALLNQISYHEGPQMYTTTLVTSGLAKKVRELHSGKLILGHPQDAFLAAALLKCAPRYLWSGVPFGWVGTSSKSAGLAITKGDANSVQQTLALSYSRSVSEANSLPYSSKVDFRHGVNARYFFDALKAIWPEVLSQPKIGSKSFLFRLDSNLISCLNKNSGVKITRTEIVTTQHSLSLKTVMGEFLTVRRQVIALMVRVSAFAFRSLLVSKYSYFALDQVSDLESLYLSSVSAVKAQAEGVGS